MHRATTLVSFWCYLKVSSDIITIDYNDWACWFHYYRFKWTTLENIVPNKSPAYQPGTASSMATFKNSSIFETLAGKEPFLF